MHQTVPGGLASPPQDLINIGVPVPAPLPTNPACKAGLSLSEALALTMMLAAATKLTIMSDTKVESLSTGGRVQ